MKNAFPPLAYCGIASVVFHVFIGGLFTDATGLHPVAQSQSFTIQALIKAPEETAAPGTISFLKTEPPDASRVCQAPCATPEQPSAVKNQASENSDNRIIPPEFLAADLLNTRPKILSINEFDLSLPGTNEASGKAIVNLWIDASGKVVNVEFSGGDLPAAIQFTVESVFKKALFIPGEMNGTPVASILKIEVTYSD